MNNDTLSDKVARIGRRSVRYAQGFTTGAARVFAEYSLPVHASSTFIERALDDLTGYDLQTRIQKSQKQKWHPDDGFSFEHGLENGLLAGFAAGIMTQIGWIAFYKENPEYIPVVAITNIASMAYEISKRKKQLKDQYTDAKSKLQL